MRRCVRRLLGVAAVAVIALPGLSHADMWDEMQAIGVPDPNTNDVLFFGWTPVADPPNSLLTDISSMDFGLAMYQSGTKLRFAFLNLPSAADPSIDAIYFDDRSTDDLGVYFHTGTVANSSPNVNVDFGNSGPPPWNFPEGNSIGFEPTDTISVRRDGNESDNINDDPEFLILEYVYADGVTFSDVSSAFQTPDLSGNALLRIAMHVQSIGTASTSDAILWVPYSPEVLPPPGPLDPPAVVPVPGAASLGLLGFGLIAAARRRARK